MARAKKVEKARKDYPDAGIKKGDTYYWWKFRYGGRRFSLTYPKRSQLTQSEFLGNVYELEDRIEALSADSYDDAGGLATDIEDIANDIREQGEECSERRDNMPEQLQDSDSGELLQGRYDTCEEWASALEEVDTDFEDDFPGEDDESDEPEEPDDPGTNATHEEKVAYDQAMEEYYSNHETWEDESEAWHAAKSEWEDGAKERLSAKLTEIIDAAQEHSSYEGE